MVSGVLLALLVLQARVVLTELLVLSDQRAIWVLPDPWVGMVHKAHLVRRVTLENVALPESVGRSVPLAPLAPLALLVLLVLLVRERITSGPSR